MGLSDKFFEKYERLSNRFSSHTIAERKKWREMLKIIWLNTND